MNNLRLLTGLLAVALGVAGMRGADTSRQVMTLDEIFAAAESGSSQLRSATAAEATAREGVSVARAERLPDINASLSVSYIGDGFTTARNFSDYQRAPIPHFGDGLGVTVEQPLYTGGAITSGIKMAELQLTAARYATELRRDNIRMALTGYYLDLYKYSNLRTVVEQNAALARRVLAEMEARYDQGVALRNDITRYELLVSNLDLQLVKINNLLEILNNNLVTTAGLPAGTLVEPDSALLEKSLPRETEAAWQSEALAASPTLSLARTELDISRRAEKLAEADRLPKVGLKAAWTIDGPILVEVPPINRNLSYWYVGLGVSYDISSLFKTNKKLSQSRAATMAAADRLDAAHDEVAMALRADYVRYLEAYEELRTQTKAVELAERNYDTTSTRYSADMALITDMVDAANSRLDAQQRLVNARIDIIYYYYKLLFTSGKI
ncbi:MAG: TolC family protein [Candidatus Amulumruptor caecigallinarius]|nr:TolC family protein [Candidatus Amulumruptor caecigallinarius]MCM1396600.1 TolC family protein [Candidatus Amulumruptor caecigallinarius]MCM1453342.1 TolC family protein [bacterium]